MNHLRLDPFAATNFEGFEIDPSIRPEAKKRAPQLFGQLVRCEAKLRQASRASRRYGPCFVNGHHFRPRKFYGSTRLWNYWSEKHNGFAIQIRDATGLWLEMPEDCNGV